MGNTTFSGLSFRREGEFPSVEHVYITKLITGTTTFDPPSLATVTGAVSSGITVTGAALGDRVELFPPYDTQGVLFQGFVSAADTIKISLFNPTGSTIDLASGTWGVKVVRG